MAQGKQDIIDGWYKEAQEMTWEKLPSFLERLSNVPMTHDFEICAVGAAAIAAAWAMNEKVKCLSNCGASEVMWKFIQGWMCKTGPMRLLCFEDMFYPQNEERFDKTIDKGTAEWLRITAHEKMQKWFDHDYEVAPEVFWHWAKMDAGELPFGYRIKGLIQNDLKTQADVLRAYREGRLVYR